MAKSSNKKRALLKKNADKLWPPIFTIDLASSSLPAKSASSPLRTDMPGRSQNLWPS
ncbi:hypothetical protein E8E15_001684 [Penicillium rubens]|nr:hypothetical protein E8E15_001684 [Penicillium rubens]